MTHVDPEAQQATYLPAQLVETNEATSDRRRRQLGEIDGDDVRSNASPQPRQDTPSVENAQPTSGVGTTLKAGAHGKGGRRDGQTVLPPDPVAEDVGQEGAEEGAGDEEGHDVLADESSFRRAQVGEAELLCGFVSADPVTVDFRRQGAGSSQSERRKRVLTFLNEVRVTVVPMNALVYPIMLEPHDAMTAST